MNSLLFLGDTAWPSSNCLDLSSFKKCISDSHVILNLEGPILERNPSFLKVFNNYKFNIYSCKEFLDLSKDINVIACCLANNHSTDYLHGFSNTINLLKNNRISYFGTNKTPFFEYSFGDYYYQIFGVCSNLTQANFSNKKIRPQPLAPRSLLRQIKILRKRNQKNKIVIYIHWGYELSPFPQPADRELAKRLIDEGADFVIGHHPHVIQPIEQYNNGIIVYSLGNFLLPQQFYRERKLSYKNDSVLDQLGMRICDKKISFVLMKYDIKNKAILFIKEVFLDEVDSLGLKADFSNMDDITYKKWFKQKINKSKFLPKLVPVFNSYFGLSSIDSLFKLCLMKFRWLIRNILIKFHIHKPHNW